MTVEADLCTVLKSVCPRTFPDFAEIATQRPYVIYQQIPGGVPVNYLDKVVPTIKNGIYQVTVWAESRAQASALSLQIEAALITATAFQAEPNSSPHGDSDPDMRLYASHQDFNIWSYR